jgi:hypothetical protein
MVNIVNYSVLSHYANFCVRKMIKQKFQKIQGIYLKTVCSFN